VSYVHWLTKLNPKTKTSSKEKCLNPLKEPALLTRGTSFLFLNPQTDLQPLRITAENYPLIPLRKEAITSAKDLGILLQIAQIEKSSL